jgi:hypothetical protein
MLATCDTLSRSGLRVFPALKMARSERRNPLNRRQTMFKIRVDTVDGWTSYLGPDNSDECYMLKTRTKAWDTAVKWIIGLPRKQYARIEEVSVERW